jgi:hypothetical protein
VTRGWNGMERPWCDNRGWYREGRGMSLSAASSRVRFAQMNIESRRYDDAVAQLDGAEGFLDGLPEEEAGPVRAEIVALRAAAEAAIAAERTGQLVRAAQRQFDKARSDIDAGNIMPSGIEDTIRVGVTYLDGLADADRAPMLAQAEELRARLRGDAPRAGTR